jgi:Cellulase N-terminal ig-like domain
MKPLCLSLRMPVGPFVLAAAVFLFLLSCVPSAFAADAYVRVNQIGYEADGSSRAYLMSTVPETGARFVVVNSKGRATF